MARAELLKDIRDVIGYMESDKSNDWTAEIKVLHLAHQALMGPSAVEEPKEAVNHPLHYGGDTVYEVIKVIEAWELDFPLGNAVKYISRAGKKDPSKELEDLRKAEFYLQRRISQLEPSNG